MNKKVPKNDYINNNVPKNIDWMRKIVPKNE